MDSTADAEDFRLPKARPGKIVSLNRPAEVHSTTVALRAQIFLAVSQGASMKMNSTRVLLGGLAGGFVWMFWSWLTGYLIIGMARYDMATQAGLFLKTSRGC
jgi:uncharacterized protein (AIM24 family)